MDKIVLLDRDGTLIVDPWDDRVTDDERILLFADTIAALKKLKRHGFGVILITNQAGIAEGRITRAAFEIINTEVIKRLETSGVKILKTYLCPHGPADGCDCRKPKPGMLLQAAKDYEFDLSQVYMVGDHRSDILAGKRAGAKTIFVKTATHPDEAAEADYQADDLTAAVEHIIATS